MDGELCVPTKSTINPPQNASVKDQLKTPLLVEKTPISSRNGTIGGSGDTARSEGLSVVSYLTVSREALEKERRVNLVTGEVRYPTVKFWQGGSLAYATRNRAGAGNHNPEKRGKPDPTFSQGARRRIMRTFATVKRPADSDTPLFITLTAPGKPELWQNTTPEDWHRMLDTFWKRVKRAWGDASAIWRLEPQKRGAPHFHLVVWGIWQGGIPKNRPKKRQWVALVKWVSRAWWEVWGSGDQDHLKAGTNCQVVNNWKHLCFYVSKYMGKVGVPWPIPGSVGRLWGILGREQIPWAEELTYEVTEAQAVKIIRLFRKKAGLTGRAFNALYLYCDASFWHNALSGVLC